MNVFGVGPAELVLILVVALIFIGPERLPRFAADLARTIREIRKYTASFAAEFNEVVKEFEKEIEPEKSEWKDIGEGLSSAAGEVTGAVSDVSREVEGAQRDAQATSPNIPTPIRSFGAASERAPQPESVEKKAQ